MDSFGNNYGIRHPRTAMKKCPVCGANIPYRDNYCYACDRTFGDPEARDTDPPRLDLSKEEWRKPWAAAVLSAAGIGLGQFYNGETAKGVLFLAVVLGAPFILPVFTPFNPVFVMAVFWAAAVADAWLSAGNQKDAPEYPATEMDAFRSTQSYRDAMAAYNQAIKLDPLMSVEISAHVLAATQSLVEMYDGILDDIGKPMPSPS